MTRANDAPLVVGVQHRCAVRPERLDQLALGQRNAFEGVEEFDVGVATLVTTPMSGRATRATRGSRPRDSCRFRPPPRGRNPPAQHRQRQADMIVQLPPVLETGISAASSAAIASLLVVFPALPVTAVNVPAIDLGRMMPGGGALRKCPSRRLCGPGTQPPHPSSPTPPEHPWSGLRQRDHARRGWGRARAMKSSPGWRCANRCYSPKPRRNPDWGVQRCGDLCEGELHARSWP